MSNEENQSIRYTHGQKYKDGIVVNVLYGSSVTALLDIIIEDHKEYKTFKDEEDHIYYIKDGVKHYLLWG